MHEQSNEGKGERIRKKAFYTISVIAIIAILLYSLTSNMNIIKSPVSEKPVGEVPVSAIFDSAPNLKFQKTLFEEIKFTTTKDAASINVQDSALDFGGLDTVDIVMQNFKGSLSTQDGRISFKGTANNIYINNVGIKNEEKQLSVSSDGSEYKKIFLPKVHIETIDYTTSGELLVGSKKVSLNLQNEPVTIKGYDGILRIDDGFRIDGTSDSIKTPDFRIEK